MRGTLLATAAALLLVTACDGDGSPSASPSPSVTTPAPVTTSVAPSSSSPTPTWPAGCASPMALPAGATVITAVVSRGAVTPPRKTYDVKLRGVVRIMVTSDVADELHLHTYDRKTELKPGCPGVIDFEAGIAGTVEAELEDAGLHLFQVRAQ